MTNHEEDKLRHLAIRRDVLVIADEDWRPAAVMLETCASVLIVSTCPPGTGWAVTWESIRCMDRDGKAGLLLSRWEYALPLIDLAYFDLVVYAGELTAEATEEFLSIVRTGCRRDALLALLTTDETAASVQRWGSRTKRCLTQTDGLMVLGPARIC